VLLREEEDTSNQYTRLPGFKVSAVCIQALVGMFLLGAGHLAVETFLGINIRQQYLKF
jgi:hypothetical protein